MNTHASRPPFIDLGIIKSSRRCKGWSIRARPGEELVAGIAEFLIGLGGSRGRIGIELELLVVGGEDSQPIADRVSEAGAILDRLAFLGVCPGSFLLARVVVGCGFGLGRGVIALDRIARGVEHRGDLAADGGEVRLGLGLAVDCRGYNRRAFASRPRPRLRG